MDLTKLTNDQFGEQLELQVKNERKIQTDLLYHLIEAERRKFYSLLKFSSLWSYVTKELAYAEDQASRRISAARVLRQFPEIGPKLNNGLLSLTNVNAADRLFRREKSEGRPYTPEQKRDLLKCIEGKSKREAALIIARLAPGVELPDRIRVITEEKVELRYVADASIRDKIDIVRERLAHTLPDASLGQLNLFLLDYYISNTEIPPVSPAPARVKVRYRGSAANQQNAKRKTDHTSEKQKKPMSEKEVYEEVRRRDKVCRNCGSAYALQTEHIIPLAKGGKTTLENCCRLCRNCNLRAAMNEFGVEKMEPYLRPK